ncbi:DUF7344 domain-containing protein [Halobellus salinisoli]|uniref:DUF7344 domain-containing protein n=1 Tax=Halobellus salinisoli TaxID=3108500 RepID=UPI00300AD8F6
MSDLQQQISTETALELLTNQQRRQILRRIADTPDGATIDQLVKQLGAANSIHPDGNGSFEHRGIELHHVHLPMLQDANVVDYDASQGTVHRGREFQGVLSLLEVIDAHRKETSTTFS